MDAMQRAVTQRQLAWLCEQIFQHDASITALQRARYELVERHDKLLLEYRQAVSEDAAP